MSKSTPSIPSTTVSESEASTAKLSSPNISYSETSTMNRPTSSSFSSGTSSSTIDSNSISASLSSINNIRQEFPYSNIKQNEDIVVAEAITQVTPEQISQINQSLSSSSSTTSSSST